MTPMRVLKPFSYDKKRYAKGEIVNVQDRYVLPLEIGKVAEKAQQAANRDLSSLTVAALKELAHLHGIGLHAGARKAEIIATLEHASRYNRRDMRAIG